jgi:cation:H+ antiporter
MTTLIYSLIFALSCFLFFISGEIIVKSLIKVAKFLGWKEFAVSFMIMSVVASFPNLFVGIFAALNNIPELAFGDIVGGNVVDLTLSVALASLFAKRGIPAKSKTVHTTLFFTIIAAIMPLLLIQDGVLSRADGIILIFFFFLYIFWLFSKKERFTKTCDGTENNVKNFKASFASVFKIFGAVILFIVASQGIVHSAKYFADTFHWPILLIGLFIVGLGNCLPEIFFAVVAAKKQNNWLVLGDLMGAVVAPATMVLGTVALISPIRITDVASLAVARIFMFLSVFFFFIFIRNDDKITKKEAAFLLFIYIFFILVEVFV